MPRTHDTPDLRRIALVDDSVAAAFALKLTNRFRWFARRYGDRPLRPTDDLAAILAARRFPGHYEAALVELALHKTDRSHAMLQAWEPPSDLLDFHQICIIMHRHY